MNRISVKLIRFAAISMSALLFFAATAFAGPPLICHQIDIGSAKSLPWISHDWNLNGTESYDRKHLAADTLAILASDQTVLVHMETLRRATLYARGDAVLAKQLLTMIVSDAKQGPTNGQSKALRMFDAGYLAEAYKQWLGEKGQNPASGLDGYALVREAIRLRGGSDPQMDFAAALISMSGPAQEHQEFAQKAIAGAKQDPLLARNLSTHFLGASTEPMAEMIGRNSGTKVAKQ